MRRKLEEVEPVPGAGEKHGIYVLGEPPVTGFIHSGSTLLDRVLGGGWALSRVSNVIGNKATGKTLLAIEACANFARQFPEGSIFYREGESAFDKDFAATLGMPLSKVDFGPEEMFTIEDLFDDITSQLTLLKKRRSPGLYIIDSLDSYSDEAEQEADIHKGSYGATKAKMMSQLFRQKIKQIGQARMHLMVISQIRDRIGAVIGRKWTRSGGRALDFYASQVIYLDQIEMLKSTRSKVERPVGVTIRTRCEKNKITMPYRECEFPIMFGYGIDDLRSCIEWLSHVGELSRLTDKTASAYITEANKLTDTAYFGCVQEASKVTSQVWEEVEDRFRPVRSKYQ